MRVIWKALIAGAFVITAVAISQTNSCSGPVFAKDGDLVLPTGFREWVFMGGPVTPDSLNNGEAPFPEFHDVYIERENLLYYQHHGNFPEGTVLVKELVLTQKGKYPDGSLDSASGRGYFPSELHGSDVMVKDSKRFANTNKWGFFTFGHQAPPYSPSAKVMPRWTVRILPHCRRCQNGHGLGTVLPFAAREAAVNIRGMPPARRPRPPVDRGKA